MAYQPLLIISLQTVKWLQVLGINSNNSIKNNSFIYSHLNGSKFSYVLQTIQ